MQLFLRVFVADTHNSRIVVFDRDGKELFRFGERGMGPGQFLLPTDVAVDSDNRLAFEGGLLDPVIDVDRMWKDTWHASIGMRHRGEKRILLVGLGWDSSAVSDNHRTLDLPVDQVVVLKGQMVWPRENKLDYAVGTSLIFIGDAEIDQTSQGVRVVGEFDTNFILFLGLTIAGTF